MSSAVPVLTIDGPSGSGKGTISRSVARALNWHLLDSGALYRLVAFAGRQANISLDDAEALARVAETFDIRFGSDASGEEAIHLGGQEVTRDIRTEQAGNDASRVAALPRVRAALLERQRRFAAPPGLVADGRDMGTVVFPAAPLKVFLTASPEERARRRHKQLKDKGSGVSLAALSREIAERDLKDSTRAVAPLRPAADAHVIDSTALNIQDVIEQVLALGRNRSLWS